MMKKILLLLLIGLTMISTSYGEGLSAFNDVEVSLDLDVSNTQQYVNIEANSSLALRRNPKKGSSVISQLTRDEQVIVLSEQDGWSYVEIGKNKGYVLSRYLSDSPAPDDLGTYTVSSNGRVKVRKYPDGDFKFYVYPGDQVRVLSFVYDDKTNEPLWARINFDNKIGYMKIKFLEEIEDDTNS